MVDTTGTEPDKSKPRTAESDRGGSRPDVNAAKKRRRLLAFLVLLAGSVGAALAAHEAWLGNRRRPAGPMTDAGQRRFRPQSDTEPANLAEYVRQARQPVPRGHPGDVPPPSGAERISSARLGDDRAAYDVSSSPEQVIAHYEAVLADRGYRKVAERTDAGRRTVVFHGDSVSATVSLRRIGREGKMVRVTLIVIGSPAGANPDEIRQE